jgi:hypothetical protein
MLATPSWHRGLIQPVTGILLEAEVRKSDRLTTSASSLCRFCWKCGSLDVSKSYGPPWSHAGIVLLYFHLVTSPKKLYDLPWIQFLKMSRYYWHTEWCQRQILGTLYKTMYFVSVVFGFWRQSLSFSLSLSLSFSKLTFCFSPTACCFPRELYSVPEWFLSMTACHCKHRTTDQSRAQHRLSRRFNSLSKSDRNITI